MHGYLGVDIGGTGSRWTVIGEDGTVVGRGVAPGATGHLFNPAERTRFVASLAEIGEGIQQPIAAAHLGITGFGERSTRDVNEIVGAQFGVDPQSVSASDDMELSYLTVFRPGEGHLVAAGTGSIGLHIGANGERLRVGGRGMLIDDGGSGTWIVLTALRRLYQRIDETGDPGDATELATRLHNSIGGTQWDDVRAFIYGTDRGRIGSLAQSVAAAAGAGDPMAIDVLHDAVVELTRLADALIARIGNLPVAFLGGVINIHPMIRMGLERELPSTEVSFPRIDAALHAARIARSRARGLTS